MEDILSNVFQHVKQEQSIKNNLRNNCVSAYKVYFPEQKAQPA